jgi:iron complex outermembrane receptor protein
MGHVRVISAFVLLLLIIGPPASGQTAGIAPISGTITNSLTGEPAANITVSLESATLTQTVRTGTDGKYTFVNVPSGTYHLALRGNAYLTSRREVTVAGSPQTIDIRLDPELHYSEVTTVSPDTRNQFDAYQATNVLGGQELTMALQNTLGATLQNEPGVATRSLGPGPARPVIRGLDGDRVLVLQDGMRMGDLSSQSGDHGVNVNPAAASRLEVVRGPATLLYGANAIGGLVNVVTDEIPSDSIAGARGGFTFDASSGAPGGGGAGDITVGNGTVALHVSGGGRRAGDYTTPDGTIPNSFTRAGEAQIGVSYTKANGYFGGSYAYDHTHYGVPLIEEGETNLDPRRQIVNLRGERRWDSGMFESVRGSFGLRRYRHDERDGEEVATSFRNDTSDLDFMASHRRIRRMRGSLGASFQTREFETKGAEALSPAVSQKGGAIYLYEEVSLSPHVDFQFGGRYDHQRFTPAADEPARDFNNVSGSLGLLIHPTDATSLAFSIARASRNPALEELYFHGPHPGTFAVENGNADLQSEHALGFDASFRWRTARASGDITVFTNRIDNFIFRELTEEVEDDLPVTFFTQANATLAGVESHVDVRLTNMWSVEAGLDYVRGNLRDVDRPLPRMPPLRGRAGVRFQKNAFQTGLEGVFAAKQDRLYTLEGESSVVGETPTPGYSLLKLFASYSVQAGRGLHTITVRLDNATDVRYRNHLNYLKDLTPEVGRDFRIVYGVRF